MVKLKVQARVLPESEYDTATGSSRLQSRKFIVIVRNPEEWYVGTLAQEVARTYQRMYKQPLGKVKYLKDRDDCDLDPEQLVSDVLVDEGKAATDGHDQEALFVVIQEQGHPVRYNSVVPDLTPVHYQNRPPPPKFSELTSSLGKRRYGEPNDVSRLADKRSRLVEIPETQQEAIPTIERSPELIRNTQHEQEEEEVFDDAQESHDHSKLPNEWSTTGAQLPRTPSSGLIANGLNSSITSKFKASGRNEGYAAPESDIEDSQMSPRGDAVPAPERQAMQAIEAKLTQRSHNDDDVSVFNAQEALQPTSIDDLIASSASGAQKPKKDALTNGQAEISDQNSSNEDASMSSESAAPALANSQVRKTLASPVKASITSASPGHATSDLSTATQTKKRKRQPAENATDSTVNGKETQKVPEPKLNGRLQVGLPASPSRRTSGVISELDSPGEQLSQSLWNSAPGSSLAEGVANVLTDKEKASLRKQKRKKKSSQDQSSGSASSSRPTSSAGILNTSSKIQPSPKKMHETAQQPTKSQVEPTTKSVKPMSLSEKIKEAKSAVESSGATKDGKTSKKDVIKSATQAADGKAKATKPATPAAQSGVPLPNWGTGSRDSKSPSVNAKPSLIVPPGMTEAEYLAMRARHEATPQPPKSAAALKKKKEINTGNSTAPHAEIKEKPPTSQKKKDSSPSKGVKLPAAAKSVAEAVKSALKKAPKAAKSAVEQQSSSSSSEETTSSSEESEPENDAKSKTTESRAPTKPSLLSKSPGEGHQNKTPSAIKDKDKTAMPPPTPKSTATRRQEKHVERASSSAESTNDSSETGSTSTSKSQSPAIAPPVTPAKPSTAPISTKKAASTTASATKAAAKLPEQPVSKLKALRQKLHSEAASKDSSPAPSSIAAKRKKPAPAQSSSSDSDSSDDSSSSDDTDVSAKKQAARKNGKTITPLARPDPTIRDVTPDSSDTSDDSE